MTDKVMSVNTRMYVLRHQTGSLPEHSKLEAVKTGKHWKQTRKSVFWKNIASYKLLVHTFHCSGTPKQVDGRAPVKQMKFIALLSTHRGTTPSPKLFSLLIRMALCRNRTARKIFGPKRK
jgi:hypothetical protein